MLFASQIVRRVTVNKRNGNGEIAENSGGVKKKPMIILKKFIFIRFKFQQAAPNYKYGYKYDRNL